MIELIKEYWSEILSIVGAAAWMPIILNPIFNYFRRVQATVLDARILTNGHTVSVGKREKKNGTILLIALNFFIRKATIFANHFDICVKLNNGASLRTENLDYSTLSSNNDNGTISDFFVPVESEFNISRTIHPNVDNIKYIAILVESASFSNLDEISEIEIRLYYTKFKNKLLSKKIKLKSSDFPRFNSSHLIDEVERVRK